MNLGDVTRKTVPKMCLVAPPRDGGSSATRTFIPHRVHEAIGVLGAVSVATACVIPGSVASQLARRGEAIRLAHRSGTSDRILHGGCGSRGRAEHRRAPRHVVAHGPQAHAWRCVRARRDLEPLVIAQVCLLGFGEVGQILAADLRAHVASITAWDLKFAESSSAPKLAAGRLGVQAAADARSAVAGADLVISAVTAGQIGEAAGSVARHLKRAGVLLRSQFHLAGGQTGRCGHDRRGGRQIRRSRDHVADHTAPRGLADVARRIARRGFPAPCSAARLHRSAVFLGAVRHGLRSQDVPQRRGQGTGGA